MDDQELERLIADLRDMMNRMGFGWAAVEAEETLYPTVALRTRALALIDAAEGATVDLAEVEMSALDILGSEGIDFAPDDEEEQDAGGDGPRYASRADGDVRRAVGRRPALAELAAQRSAFDALRGRIDGD